MVDVFSDMKSVFVASTGWLMFCVLLLLPFNLLSYYSIDDTTFKRITFGTKGHFVYITLSILDEVIKLKEEM